VVRDSWRDSAVRERSVQWVVQRMHGMRVRGGVDAGRSDDLHQWVPSWEHARDSLRCDVHVGVLRSDQRRAKLRQGAVGWE
jgi:hypothetical protein